MSFYNHYKILGVPHTAEAEVIRAAYKQLALKYHPDKNPGNAEAEEVFKLIANAYSVLSDPIKKATYDRQLRLSNLQVPVITTPKKAEKDRRYGSSRRMFKSKRQIVAEQIAWYEQRTAKYSYFTRAVINGLLVAGGWMLVFKNWFFDISSYTPAAIFAGVLIFLIACGAFFNNLYLEWEYQVNRGVRAFDFGGRAVTACLFTIVGAGALMWAATEMRFRYHLSHYAVHSVGEVYDVRNTNVYYRFTTASGTVDKWERFDEDVAEELQKEHFVSVEYSSENPNIARIIQPE